MDALDKAIKEAGNQAELAKMVGGGQTRISEWRRRGRVSAEAVIKVAQAVQFKVTPHELRPDLYPHPDDGMPTDLRCLIPTIDDSEARAAE